MKTRVFVAALLLVAASCKSEATTIAGTPLSVNVVAEGFDMSNTTDLAVLNAFIDNSLKKVNQVPPFNFFTTPLQFNLPISVPPGKPLGLKPKDTGCYFDFENDDADEFFRRLEAVSPLSSDKLTIIVVKVPPDSRAGACALQSNLIITSQRVSFLGFSHEFGHSIGLLQDETDSGSVDTRVGGFENCTADQSAPGWVLLSANGQTMTPVEGCKGQRSGLFRPQGNCRMRDGTVQFDCVCKLFLIRQLSAKLGVQQPEPPARCRLTTTAPPPANMTASGHYVTVDYYGDKKLPRIVESSFAERVLVRSSLANGTSFEILMADGNVVSAASLPDPLGYARAYPAEGPGMDTKVPSPLPTRLILFAPNTKPETKFQAATVTKEGLSGKSLLDKNTLSALTQAVLQK